MLHHMGTLRQLFVPVAGVLLGAGLFLTLGATAHAITNLDVEVNKNSYTYNKDDGSITWKTNLFSGGQVFFPGSTSSLPGGGIVQCRDGSVRSADIVISNAADIWRPLQEGKNPKLKIKLTISGTDANNDTMAECNDAWKKIQTQGTNIDTKEKEAATEDVKRDTKVKFIQNEYGSYIGDRMKNLRGNFKLSWAYNNISEEDLLAKGCSKTAQGVRCDAVKNKLFDEALGICWHQAETVVQNRTFGGTGFADKRELFVNCVQQFIDASRSRISTEAGGINEDEINKLREKAEQDAANHLGAEAEIEGDKEETCGSRLVGVGWFMCTMLDAAVGLADASWGLFEWLLTTQPLKVTDEGGAETAYYKTWSNVRNIANVLLVVFFIFTIYSQITGAGLSNYGIKKALPRILIMAIAINISFLVIQLAFDVANIIGSSLDKLIAGQAATIKPNIGNLITDIIVGGALSTVGVAGVIGAASVAGGGAALILAILIILPGVIAFIAGLVTLMIRAALLPIIAVFAPVAFVAYILPNTQPFFDKWKQIFTSMLFLYPIAAAYYGALKFTAFILIGQDDPGATLQRLMGFALLLFGSGVVVWLAIKSNAITGRIAGGIQGALSKVASPVEKLGRATMAGMAMERMGAFRAQDFSKKSRLNPMRHIGRGMQAFDRSKRDRELRTALQNSEADQRWRQGLLNDPSRLRGLEGGAGGQGYLSKLEAEAVSNKEVSLRNQDLQALAKTLEEAIKSGDTITAKAAQNRLLNSGSAGLETFNGTIANADTSPDGVSARMRESLSSNIRDNHATAMDKDMGTMKWATGSRTMVESQNDAAIELAEKGIATEKFAQMTEAAQKRLLESPGGSSILTQGQITALTDQSGQYGGKVGKSVVAKLNTMKSQPQPPNDPSDSYSI